MMKINIVGARPNSMKMDPIIEAMNQHPEDIQHILVHTGQHYDEKMSKSFFVDLGMPKPDTNSWSWFRQSCRADGKDHGCL